MWKFCSKQQCQYVFTTGPLKKKIQDLLSYIIFVYSFFSGAGVGWTSASKLKLYRRCYLLKKKKKIVWKVLTAMSSCCLVFIY